MKIYNPFSIFSRSVSTKVAFRVITVTAVLFSVLLTYVFISYRDNVKEEAYAHVESRSREMSTYYRDFFNKAIESATVIEKTLLSIDPKSQPSRELVQEICKRVLETNPEYYSVWVVFEPNAYDGNDLTFANSTFEHSTETGRYSPGYYRLKNKIIVSPSVLDAEILEEDYYQLPKKIRKPVILEPYLYSYSGDKKDEILETTIAVPLIENEKFIGVVGIDISLEKLNEHNNKLKLYKSGFGKLVTETGILVAHPDPKKIMTLAADTKGKNGQKILNLIKSQEYKAFEDYSFVLKQETFKVFSPLKIEKADLNWTYVFVIPVKEIMEKTQTKINNTIILSSGLFLLLIIILVLAIRSVTQPIKRLTKRLNTLSKGQIQKLEIVKVKGTDEIASMLKESNHLLEGLKSTAQFAIEIGKGKFDSQYTPLSEEDELGQSLIEMRKNLLKAEQDHIARQIEDTNQMWANDGMTHFSELVRNHRNNMQTLSQDLVSFIVHHMGALQGAIFFVKQDEQTFEKYLELTATYAFTKERNAQTRIRIGEGLVGCVAQEKKVNIINNLPLNYTKIESGLGLSTPKTLILLPIQKEENFIGVLELGFLHPVENHQIKWLEKISEEITIIFELLKVNIRTEQLLAKSNEQAELMRQQEEELRQNLEELQATQDHTNSSNENNQAIISELRQEIERLRSENEQYKNQN